jgi:hypothetical protein
MMSAKAVIEMIAARAARMMRFKFVPTLGSIANGKLPAKAVRPWTKKRVRTDDCHKQERREEDSESDCKSVATLPIATNDARNGERPIESATDDRAEKYQR